ncbi:hypothetical protein FRB90_009807, partial [Tulasnella sp. 427]
MDANDTFKGDSAEECESFLASVHQKALVEGTWHSDPWIIFYATSLLRGKALVFYEDLDPKTKGSWAAIRTALVNQYVRSEHRNANPLATYTVTVPPPSDPIPIAAAAPPPTTFLLGAQTGRILVMGDSSTEKWYLSSQQKHLSHGLSLCRASSDALLISFTAPGADLFEIYIKDALSKEVLCVQWPLLDGDDWVQKLD